MKPINDKAAREFLADLERRDGVAKTSTDEPAYKLAKRTPVTKNWEPKHISGDAAVRESIELGGARVREQVRNNPQFVKARSTLTNIIVGRGINAFSMPFTFQLDDLLNPDESVALARLSDEVGLAWESDQWFKEWSEDAEQCDAEGHQSFSDFQRQGFADTTETGDSLFIVRQQRKPGRLVPYSLQQVEREQLDRTIDRERRAGTNAIVNGVELDDNNRAVAFHLFVGGHPDDNFSGFNQRSTRVPASKVIHNFVKFRPSMHVGFSWFHAMGQVARDRNWLVGSKLTNAAIGALLTLVHYQEKPGGRQISLDFGDDQVDEHGNEVVELATGGNSVTVPAGDKLELFQGAAGGEDLRQFIDILDQDGAAGTGLSNLRYTGNWEKLSYTAGRGAQLDDEMYCRPLREWWSRSFVIKVRRAVNAQMIATGKIKRATPAMMRQDGARLKRFFCVGPGREMLDPEKETDASLAQLRSGLSTLQIESGKRGLHWLETMMQMRRELMITRIFGVKLDFSKGQGGQATETTTDAESEQPADA